MKYNREKVNDAVKNQNMTYAEVVRKTVELGQPLSYLSVRNVCQKLDNPHVQTVVSIANAIDVNISEFFDNDDDGEQREQGEESEDDEI